MSTVHFPVTTCYRHGQVYAWVFPSGALPCVPKGKRGDLLKCIFYRRRFPVILVVHVNMRELCCVTGQQHVLFSGCSVSVSFVNKPWFCAHVHVRGVSSPPSLRVTMSCHNTIN